MQATRTDILTAASVESYCEQENGRCFVWYDGTSWLDTDLQPKLMVHGDHIRIAVPLSVRFECSTVQLVELLDRVLQQEAVAGYSPSLLAEEDLGE